MPPPIKPFSTYKWRWLSVAPTEGLLDPPVFLGALRAFAHFEGSAPSDPALLAELARVSADTGTRVNLVRTPDRNLIRNSGQYWKGTGLLRTGDGVIELTKFGRDVAAGRITQSEFVSMMIQQTVLPNTWTYPNSEVAKWQAAGLEIRPFKLILEVLEELGRRGPTNLVCFLTNDELVRVVIPLAGEQSPPAAIADNIVQFRRNRGHVANWPDCAPAANDPRMTREFLLFLANFGVLRRNGDRANEKFFMDEVFDVDAATAPPGGSIFADAPNAEALIEAVRHSAMPSIIERQRILTSILTRTGQSGFRTRILNAYGGQCFITGEAISDVLEAAHIIPVTRGGADHENNGFCLRVDIHRLFDSGHLRIKPDGALTQSDALQKSPNYTNLPPQIALPHFVNPVNVDWRHRYL